MYFTVILVGLSSCSMLIRLLHINECISIFLPHTTNYRLFIRVESNVVESMCIQNVQLVLFVMCFHALSQKRLFWIVYILIGSYQQVNLIKHRHINIGKLIICLYLIHFAWAGEVYKKSIGL